MSTINSYFAWDVAADRGAAPCVRDDSVELSYADFAERVDGSAEQLAALGVSRGDVVATFLPNRSELLVVLMAAWRLGAIATPVNPGFTTDEAEYQLADSNAVVVVGETAGGIEGARTHLAVDDLATSPSAGWQAPAAPSAGDDALLIYTSGSTGRPKGVRLLHENLQYTATTLAQFLDMDSETHALLVLPLFHVNAICVSFLAPMIAGGQLSVTGAFSVSRFFDDLVTLRPTYFSAVPTIYSLLVLQSEIPSNAFDSLKFAICGAAPASKELLDHVQETFGIPILEGYGLTEGTCVTACNPLNGVRKPGTVGPALPGQRIVLVDASGNEVPAGEAGEVTVIGPNVMRGYLNRPETTAETIIDGRLHTGDVGVLDEDGYLSIVDRIKDMIIRGGENLYPKEIENALASHPAVLECAVVGAPDNLFGEVPVAYVVAYPDQPVSAEVLADHVAPILTKVKRPQHIHIVNALPRNPVGKIDKPALRKQLRAAQPA